jgi:hypothetical protein
MTKSLHLAIGLLVCTGAWAVQPPVIHFLSASDARIALTEGSGREYYGLMQIADLRAKTGLALQGVSLEQAREQARIAYGAATLDFTPEEEAALSEAIESMQPVLAERAPIYARTPWSFIKINASIEGNLPETRGNSIQLSDQVLGWIVKARARAPLTSPSLTWNLLVHEQTHVIQRHHPELFERLYTAVFGMQHVTLAPTPDWIRPLRVINPDGPNVDWIFSINDGTSTQWLLPDLLIKNTEHPQMPQDFEIVAEGVKQQGDTWVYLDKAPPGNPKSLYGIDAYVQRFPITDELFHPNEIAAGMLAAWITGIRMKNPDNVMWEKMRAWAAVALK